MASILNSQVFRDGVLRNETVNTFARVYIFIWSNRVRLVQYACHAFTAYFLHWVDALELVSDYPR